MGNLGIWFGKVILFILYLDCLCSRAYSPPQEFDSVDVTENGLSGAHRRWFRPEDHLVPERRRSDLEVSPSQANGTAEADILLEFLKGITKDPLNVLSSWNSNNFSNHCNWTGVYCSSLTGYVTNLNLTGNQLNGFISPGLGGLQFLQSLDLSKNSFEGSIPTSLANCSYLTVLDLSENGLSGDIPGELGALSNLEELLLSVNALSGLVPPSLSNLSTLRVLMMDSNQLVGDIMSLTWGGFGRLESLNLGGNYLTGDIPPSLGNCTSLTDMIFSLNSLTGEIPQALDALTNLEFLYLHFNKFVGGIPAFLGNSSRLQEVHLDHNVFTGAIAPELGNLTNMSILDLSSNFLTGQIPASLGKSVTLLSLSLASNQLIGAIPSSIGELTNLQGLSLSDNHLAGLVPSELSNCVELSELDLSGNFLTGYIPSALENLTALNKLYLNNNNFTGLMSPAIRLKTNLLEINLAYNSLSGAITGDDFYWLRNLRLNLDLSHNLFTGPLPTGIEALQFVQKINFSFNAFSGAIPDTFSQCTGLESLDLSSNNLDGQIPPSLATLEHLTYFNVSFNQLTGPVPSQFDNFSDGSFLGNPNLCGPMLSNKCGSTCHGVLCHQLWIIIIPSVAAGITGALALAAIWFLFIAKGDSSGMVAPTLPSASHFTNEFGDLSMGDILAATNGFSDSNIMGVGARSTVFVGVLPSSMMIAAKRLELRNDEKALGKLQRELQRLSKVEHPNLLKVHGLFSTGDLKVLLLEYMPNGSLFKQLYQGEHCRLTWAERLNIALGVAEAMVHLHHAGAKPIIHQDLKPSNILLDSDMQPKVSDYGIATFLNHENHGDTTISSNLYGTIGYIPPEYGALTSVSTMGDVYNFGVVLMELFTRKQPTDDMFGQEASLCSWVGDAFPNRIAQVLDPTLCQELAQTEQDVGIHLMVRLSLACTRHLPKDRPTMIQARDLLMEIKSFELLDKKSGQRRATDYNHG